MIKFKSSLKLPTTIDYVINVIKLIKSYYKMKYIANNFLSALIIFGINDLIILSR